MQIRPTHSLVDHVGDTHLSLPLHIHPDSDKHGYDAGILAYGSVTLGTHAGVDQYLCDGIPGGLRFLPLVGGMHCLHKICRMVVGNELQRIENAAN